MLGEEDCSEEKLAFADEIELLILVILDETEGSEEELVVSRPVSSSDKLD